MQGLEIDYSSIAQPGTQAAQDDWEPPVHKYFGKKLPNGKTEKEPLYVYQPYPSMMYAQRDGKIVARVVNSDQEKAALGAGWSDTPATFGYLGAPSFEQAVAMRESQEQAIPEAEERRKPGPKPKAA